MTEPWLSDYLAQCQEIIAKYGHMVQYVGGDQREQTLPLAYTVGLSTSEGHGFELALTGLDPDTARNVLNCAADALRDTKPEEGLLVERVIIGGVVRLRKTTGGLEDFVTLRKLNNNPGDVWQVEYPDDEGNFPGDPGYGLPAELQQQL